MFVCDHYLINFVKEQTLAKVGSGRPMILNKANNRGPCAVENASFIMCIKNNKRSVKTRLGDGHYRE